MREILDDTYETEARQKRAIFRLGDDTNIHFMFQFGAGVSKKINNRFNIGLAHQLMTSDNDLLDGFELRSIYDYSNNNELAHYTNIRLGINLGDFSKKTEPLYWLNPIDATMNDIADLKQRPVFDLTDTDGDGVLDMLDPETGTPSGASVDVRGVALDSDGDGVSDFRKAPKGSPLSGPFSPELAKQKMPFGIGQFARQREMLSPRESAEYANAVQKCLEENTRLGIPAVFHDEILHGNMSSGSTVFPVPIAMAASWDPEIVAKVFTVAARQTRHRGSHHVLGPNLDLARDPRWGRTEETYGEDPYLTSRMTVAAIRAIQGGADYSNPAIDADHVVIKCNKHSALHHESDHQTLQCPRVLRLTLKLIDLGQGESQCS